MAYDRDNPPSLITQGIGGPSGLRWYALTWIDPIADVLEPGYISNADELGMRPGDGLIYKDVNRGEWDHYDLICLEVDADGSATFAFPEVPEEALTLVNDVDVGSGTAYAVIYYQGRQVRAPLIESVALPKAVYTLTQLANLDPENYATATLLDGGRSGVFVFDDTVVESTVAGSAVSYDASATTDLLTEVGHGLKLGDALFRKSATTAGVTVNTPYWVIPATDDTFKLATSYANAVAGTAVNITTTQAITLYQMKDPLQGVYVIPSGYLLDGSEGAWRREGIGSELDPRWFGFVLDSYDDRVANAAAYRAMIAFHNLRGTRNTRVPPIAGVFYFGEQIEIGTDLVDDISIFGGGDQHTQYVCCFYADWANGVTALFKGLDPTQMGRLQPINFYDIMFSHYVGTPVAPNRSPLFLDFCGPGETKLERLRFSGGNNTHVALGSYQNVDVQNWTSYFGGVSFVYKDTSNITFAITGAGATSRTLTASSAIFTNGGANIPDDVGRVITVAGANSNQVKYTISAYTSSTVVTITSEAVSEGGFQSPKNETAVRAYFESAHGSMTAGSNLLSVPSTVGCFDASHLGVIVYVPEARSGIDSARSALRGRIIEVLDNYRVRLGNEWGEAVLADNSVSDVPFWCPVIDGYVPELSVGGSLLDQNSTDSQWINVRISDYSGMGMAFAKTQQLSVMNTKIEGVLRNNAGGTLDATKGSDLAMLLDDVQGVFNNYYLSTQTALGKDRIYVSNQAGSVSFYGLESRNTLGGQEYILHLESAMAADGLVNVIGASILYSQANLVGCFQDDNTNGKLRIYGPVRNGESGVWSGEGAWLRMPDVVVTYDWASLTTATADTHDFTVTGAAVGDKVSPVIMSASPGAVLMSTAITAADTVSVMRRNDSGGSVNVINCNHTFHVSKAL